MLYLGCAIYHLRGINANVIFVDEGVYVKTALFYEVIIPLLVRRNSVLIMISSPGESSNFYHTLEGVVDEKTGQKIFLTVKPLACKRCQGTDDELYCTHNDVNAGVWEDPRRREILMNLYATQNALGLRELRGVEIDSDDNVFMKKYIDALKTKSYYETGYNFKAKTIYCGCDPGGGGASETAIVSFFYTDEGLPVVSLIISFLFYCYYPFPLLFSHS